MENTLYDAGIERKAGDWSCGSHPDTGGTDRTGHYIQVPAYEPGRNNLRENNQRKCGHLISGEVTVYLSLIFLLLLSFVMAMIESASLQMAKNYRRADTNRALECVFAEYQKELLEEYDIFALEGSYETGQYSEQNIVNRLAYYGVDHMEHQIERIQMLTDQGCQTFYNQAVQYIKHRYGIQKVEKMLGMSSLWKEQEKQSKEYAKEETDNQNRIEELLEEQEVELPQENNPLEHTSYLKNSPLLELVLTEGQEVSQKRMEQEEMLPDREKQSGYGTFADVEGENGQIGKLLFGEYLLKHFSAFTGQDHEGPLDYELEYIIAGQESDKDNLETVIKKLMILRFVPNYAYIQTDSVKKAEAEATAAALCVLLAVPAITEAAAQAILLAWAYGETIMDMRSLLTGKKVPFIKSEESWQLSWQAFLTLGTEEDTSEGMDYGEGMDYKEYLRVLLFLEKKETAAIRTLGIIEQNLRMRYGQPYFHADYCISRMEIHTECTLRRNISYDYKTYYGYQ